MTIRHRIAIATLLVGLPIGAAAQNMQPDPAQGGVPSLVRRAATPNDGAVDWLLACPEKGFFVPIESESTDTL